jgi:hypothetical protein
LSAKVKLAVSAPEAAGVNVTVAVHVPPPASVAPHVVPVIVKSLESDPVIVWLVSVTVLGVPFVIVNVCAGDVAFTAMLPKATGVGEIDTVGRKTSIFPVS